VQSSAVVAPFSGYTRPGAHLVHSVIPNLSANLPGAHRTQSQHGTASGARIASGSMVVTSFSAYSGTLERNFPGGHLLSDIVLFDELLPDPLPDPLPPSLPSTKVSATSSPAAALLPLPLPLPDPPPAAVAPPAPPDPPPGAVVAPAPAQFVSYHHAVHALALHPCRSLAYSAQHVAFDVHPSGACSMEQSAPPGHGGGAGFAGGAAGVAAVAAASGAAALSLAPLSAASFSSSELFAAAAFSFASESARAEW
jgi:hypothetical protein